MAVRSFLIPGPFGPLLPPLYGQTPALARGEKRTDVKNQANTVFYCRT